MHIKQSLLRVAAAATITAVMTVGGGATAQAAVVAGDSSKASGQGAAQAEAGQEKAEQNKAAAAEKKAQGSENQPEQAQATDAPAPTQGSKAQGPKAEADAPAPSQGDKAQGPKTTAMPTPAEPTTANSGNAADKRENGNGHTPVTVCHALGNGGYIEITFDENALEKHVDNHEDLYPVPTGGCPAPAEAAGTDKDNERATVCHLLGNGSYNLLTFDDAALPAHLAHGDHEATDEADCATEVAGTSSSAPTDPVAPVDPADPAETTATAAERPIEKFQVLGVQSERSAAPTVLGAEATANRAPATVAPVAGILPATGAGDYALVLFGGAGLLAAGAALLARRRLQGDS